MKIAFNKTLAKYYKKWYQDCLDSAKYCEENNRPASAEEYRKDAELYKKIIEENREAIEFFSQKDNAFLLDSALPEKFRGYK